MKLWLAFILSFALLLGGFANAVGAAELCHSALAHQSAQQHDDDTTPSASHEDHQTGHGHSDDHARSGKCASFCCGSICFVPVQAQLDVVRGHSAFGVTRESAVVSAIGLVQERPPKLPS